jgi:hypothetical protein
MGWSVSGQLVNMVMLSAAIAPSLAKWVPLPTVAIAVILPPSILAGVTLFGTVLDWLKWNQKVDQQNMDRSTSWKILLDRLDRIEAKLDGR